MATDERMTNAEIRTAAPEPWRQVLNALRARWGSGDFATGARFVAAVADLADSADHHPEVALAYGSVEVRLTSHDAGGVTRRDIELASQIAGAAAELGLTPEPGRITQVELGLDTAAGAELAGPYAALLGTKVRNDESVDPEGRQPTIWFQEPDAAFVRPPGAPEQRWHMDVWVGEDEGPARVAAFVAAGGVLVDDSEAPSFWVLADADGNRSCVCTVADRG